MPEADIQTGSASRWVAVLKLFAGSGSALAISLIALPFLSRLYPAEAFGWLGWGTAGAALLVPLATCCMEQAVFPATTDAKAERVARAVLRLSGYISLTLATIGSVAAMLGLLPASIAAYLALAVWLQAACQPLIFLANRRGQFGYIARARFSQALVVAISSIGIGTVLPATPGLLAANLAGLGVFRLHFRAPPRSSPPESLDCILRPELRVSMEMLQLEHGSWPNGSPQLPPAWFPGPLPR